MWLKTLHCSVHAVGHCTHLSSVSIYHKSFSRNQRQMFERCHVDNAKHVLQRSICVPEVAISNFCHSGNMPNLWHAHSTAHLLHFAMPHPKKPNQRLGVQHSTFESALVELVKNVQGPISEGNSLANSICILHHDVNSQWLLQPLLQSARLGMSLIYMV